MSQVESDSNVEIWKIKKLLKGLESARGNGTSMISLILPAGYQISRAVQMLTDEYGTATNIKSRVNRQSVMDAIVSTQTRLKLHTKSPKNGLAIFCGSIVTDDGKEKKFTIDFEPFKPINRSVYMRDNRFHTEALQSVLELDAKFGFIVMDGIGTLFGTLSGNTREILYKFTVDLPKKHRRGGQFSVRFSRLRDERRHNYVTKVAELAVQMFIANDRVNAEGIIMAGSADFKNELAQCEMLDPRLKLKILKIVDVCYGGENGFNQAIDLSAEVLSNVKFVQEKKLNQKYFDEISQDSGKYCYGLTIL
ncbi:Electron transfer flavoprotein alpha-subunit [Nowakowskiella sp. JEL0407]|nr:Electron transfer flavoprotein alpha-subunit [Nowakowskiella sp. JEL0407]